MPEAAFDDILPAAAVKECRVWTKLYELIPVQRVFAREAADPQRRHDVPPLRPIMPANPGPGISPLGYFRMALWASCRAWLYFAAAWVRLPEPSFLRMRRTWFFTVNRLMLSARPISALVLPLHIPSRISSSRALTSSQSPPSFSAVVSANLNAATLRKAASIWVTSRSTR